MHHTETEHVASEGTQCPYCGSEDFEGGPVETGGGRALQEMFCHDCERDWEDRYQLTGYEAREETP